MRVATKSPYQPRVSIIIPTYNRPKLLQEAVESALAQTYPNVEIIVVDDGSTDNTGEIVAQYGGKVTYIKQANQDVAAARNTGGRAASGEYLTFLDDDDMIMPTKIARQVQVLLSRPEVGLVHCRFYYANEKGAPVHQVGLLPEGAVLPRLLRSNFIWMGAPLVRRHCLDQVGWFDEQIPAITADWDMWLRIAQAGYRFGCVQELLGAYRIHRNGMMSDVAALEHGMFAVLEKVFSNSHVSAHAIALKEEIRGRKHFWLSCRYYAAGQWEDAQRNLSDALAMHPDLRTHLGTFVELLSHDALGPRVGDPLEFVANVFLHLPPCADGLRQYHSQVLGRTYAGLSLRDYAAGNIAHAKSQFTQAIALYPPILEHKVFARLLRQHTMHLPVSSPILYVDTVLQNLPAQARRLERVRARMLSELHVELAHQDYSTGQPGLAIRQILIALCRRPWLIRNRSVVAILLKSLQASIPSRAPSRKPRRSLPATTAHPQSTWWPQDVPDDSRVAGSDGRSSSAGQTAP
jgi:glycosyltransferase involved in cell wall biosynthesis